MRILLLVAVILTGCTKAVPREGAVVPTMPQSIEQCHAQPWLDWCPK